MKPGDGDYDDRLRELERRLATVERVDKLTSASIGAGGLRVINGGAIRSGDFDGEDLDTPGDNGWWLGPEGIVVNRAVIRTGDQTVVDHADITPSTSLTETPTTYASVAVPVPDWAETAQVIAIATVNAGAVSEPSCINGVVVAARIDGVDSDDAIASIHADGDVFIGWATATASLARTLTAPLGSTIDVGVRASIGDDTNAVNANSGAITALVMFSD